MPFRAPSILMPHAKPVSAVLKDLHVEPQQGLSSAEAATRASAAGKNELPQREQAHVLAIFFDRFKDVLVLLLLMAAFISFYLGDTGDAVIILIAVGIDAGLSFIQSWRTEKTLARMRAKVSDTAYVRRNGRLISLPAQALVIGDIIEIRSGRHVPADARLISCQALKTQEASLTGEAAEVAKSVGHVPERSVLSSRTNMIFAGTSAVAGSATAVVTAIGSHTEFGKIAAVLSAQVSPPSPLRRSLTATGLIIGAIVIACVLLLTALGLFIGNSLTETIRTAITLIVSAIPEDLTMILTIALTVGVVRIARRGGVVRVLSAAESLGAATVICADKTGTLTMGIMEASLFDFLQGDRLPVGVEPKDPIEEITLSALVLANDAFKTNANKEEGAAYFGSATERSALDFVEKASLSQSHLKSQWGVRGSIHFSSTWKYRAVLAAHPTQSTNFLFVVGAPEILLHQSSHALDAQKSVVTLSAARRQELSAAIERIAAEGSRLLAVALKRHVTSNHLTRRDVHGLTFLGLLVIRDPVRADAITALQETVGAGVPVKLMTGDHPATAKAVAAQVGLPVAPDHILVGEELQAMDDDELSHILPRISVLARIEPLDKQRIVRLLQQHGEVVAMTGDGINDAVALKGADIGVAMESGSDIAKDASDMVLLNNSLSTIVAAIKEGRVLRDNVRKVMAYLLATNMAEVLIFFVSIFMGLPLPLLPLQILWINLVTDGTSDIALSLEGPEDDVMRRGPELKGRLLLGKHFSLAILYSGIVMTIATMIIFWLTFVYLHQPLAYARTMAFSFVATSSLLSMWSFRSNRQSMFKRLTPNRWVWLSAAFSFGLQLLAIYLPSFNTWFETTPLDLQDWLLIGVVSAVTVLLIDARKWVHAPNMKNRLSVSR